MGVVLPFRPRRVMRGCMWWPWWLSAVVAVVAGWVLGAIGAWMAGGVR